MQSTSPRQSVPVVEHITPLPTVYAVYAAPDPVVEHIAPAPTVYAAQVEFMASAPAVHGTPVVEYIAPALT